MRRTPGWHNSWLSALAVLSCCLLAAAEPAPESVVRPRLPSKLSSFGNQDITIQADTIQFSDEGWLIADGNVVLTSEYGVMHTQHLTYNETSKSVEIQKGFGIVASAYRFTGEQLKLNVEQRQGSFINASGSYSVPELPGVNVFFHSLRGFLDGDTVRIE
ncbi:MAG: hypothetical protein ACREJQ_01500, partial [bacterium]